MLYRQIHNKYAVKSTPVLSSLIQVTLHAVRSKRQMSVHPTKHNKEKIIGMK